MPGYDSRPRFTSLPETMPVDDLRIVGTSAGPLSIPLGAVTVRPNGVASYETLYSFTDAAGQPVIAAYPGTYGQLVAVRSARGGRY